MFSGLIAHSGTIVSVVAEASGGIRLRVRARDAVAHGVEPKDSIALDGVCLTVVAHDDATIDFDVVPETLARSTLGSTKAGDEVNLELSLRLGDRLGGHLVYGHVDATTAILSKDPEGQGHRLTIATVPALARYVVEKGYVAIDGVSLTVAAVAGDAFAIALIPETSARTSLGRKGPGERVNLEIDPIARYAMASVGAYRT